MNPVRTRQETHLPSGVCAITGSDRDFRSTAVEIEENFPDGGP
jgi:hypothetical protein